MMGGEAPETCWATHKRQVINLWNCCILLVDLFESYDDARTCKRKMRFVLFCRVNFCYDSHCTSINSSKEYCSHGDVYPKIHHVRIHINIYNSFTSIFPYSLIQSKTAQIKCKSQQLTANSHPVNPQIHQILQNLNLHYHVDKNPTLFFILSQMNPVHTRLFYFIKTHFNRTLPFTTT